MAKLKNAPVALIIMDGCGLGDKSDKNNAVQVANTPVLDGLLAKYKTSQLQASGEYVGLPDGQMGNSEVGHTNIGAGRIIYQQLTRITRDIKNGDFFKNEALLDIVNGVKANNGALHLLGLVSPGGVHSHQDHLYALLELAKKNDIKEVYVHAFLDGRDVPPQSAQPFLEELEAKCKEIGVGCIATISGRYYAMDRDHNWDREQKAYEAIAHAEGVSADSAVAGLKASYDNGANDEFVVPCVIKGYEGMKNGDGAIFFNFRPDRARQLTHIFVDETFDGFERDENLKIPFATFSHYEDGMNAKVAFPPETITKTMGEIIESQGMTQLRIAETEKYAHVTFFFNGGVEEPYKGEDRILVPSPKVATYDLQPEMSAIEVTDKVVEAIKSGKYDFIILNYANCDMVGHTGVFPAVVKAVETVDTCVGRFVDAIREVGGEVCITADHGNADKMMDYDNDQPFTKHTTNPVPFIVVSDRVKSVKDGALCDIAPTLLTLAGVEIPSEMTGKNLVEL
ncbi:2,3-bisphosphoglycerate-independent phosphoglycerate mutase [Selenomonas caprae]|jgi:2,3-bisphosphoglycerate-independent phosphoglycerate mutase|uniref:2,3-bisphosphoglycerate-independent phosphoglycerate mutase n=2 Tax=Selenomonas TaxID=970 RepID=A0A1I3DQE3_SELRU|nr:MULTISPECIES: 2,3-bisphosphoglycerate-independent phosphoglycerate mutase [Selenomonas]MBE6074597.1 2,3-bisphosphoglycerate-independent phosphoglycerate mutase [Selenomonas ruminantium]TYZ31015.1 2,3-bisphosphoglycerate-independent phosphoglycerate mutase [Selenomonas caprae]SFH88883.1 phosphoglycerate mutase [Selenomonas ruminantium]